MLRAVPPTATPHRRRGFTLIELLTALVIVAVLTAMAYPSYASHVRKARRATAEGALMDLAARQQSFLLDRRRYATTPAELGFAAPPETGGLYTFALVTDNAASPMVYTASATPTGAQATGGERTLSVDQAGSRLPANVPGYWGK